MQRVYRKKFIVRLVCLGGLAFASFYVYLAFKKPLDPSSRSIALAFTWGLLVAAVGGVAYGFTTYVAISDDRIETRTMFRKQSLSLDQISHRREYEDRGLLLPFLELVPYVPSDAAIRIPIDDYAFDDDFWHWIGRIRAAEV